MLKSVWKYVKDHATEALVGIVSAVGLASVWATINDIAALWRAHAFEMAIWSFVCILAGTLLGSSHNLFAYLDKKKYQKEEQEREECKNRQEARWRIASLTADEKSAIKAILEKSPVIYQGFDTSLFSHGLNPSFGADLLLISEIKDREYSLRLTEYGEYCASVSRDLIDEVPEDLDD